jgi:S-adenosylmethionine synthetase
VNQVAAVRQVQVFILSQIGQPLDQPFVVATAVQLAQKGLDLSTRHEVQEVLNEYLNQMDQLREEIIEGNIPLY